MTRTHFKVTALLGALALASCATQPPTPAPAPMPQALAGAPILASNDLAEAPATQPAPAGQSDIADVIKQRKLPKATMNGELPAGHPPVSGASAGKMPAGKMPAALPDGTQLPAGHPDMAQMQAMLAERNKPASTQPAMYGALTVRAVQATAGGPAVGEMPVVVELHAGEAVIDKYEAKLDADAVATFNNVPVSLHVTPVVKVTYNDVEYTAVGEVMDPHNAKRQVQVPVYESTEEAPAWSVQMQHVMLEPTTDGIRVMEMLAIANPSDRTWIGTPHEKEKRATLRIPLPAGATDVQLSGAFHQCCVTIEDGRIVDSMPLVPGVSQYRMMYTLPVSSGSANVAMKTAAPVKHFMLFLPDDSSKVKVSGLADAGVADMGGGKTRYYKSADLAAGADINLDITGITARATAATDKAQPARRAASGNLAKIIAGAGGLLIFVVGGMLVMLKVPKAKKA